MALVFCDDWRIRPPLKFPQPFIDEVRAAADIVTVISDYVSLRKAGASYKGLCPFHGEKTPSFNVNRDRGFFHCFGCGVGGDVFKFVELQEKVGFQRRGAPARAAVRHSDPRAGGERRAARDAPPSARRCSRCTRSRSPTSASSSRRPPARASRDYLLKERGLTQETIDDAADRLGAAVARRAAPAAAEGRASPGCSS